MWKQILVVAIIALVVCSKYDPIELSPFEGVTITIFNLTYHKSEGKVIGSVQIRNNSGSFVRVSNRELFLCSAEDSSRTFINMPGEWKIDEKLVNVMSGKTITYKAYWQLQSVSDTLMARYIRILEREDG
ncbi:MAG: hypothetical protein JW915_20740 [Chitinispirillaceae bacterium]|nr:hypothetical protein [Chitinispirillaceae bacterium]